MKLGMMAVCRPAAVLTVLVVLASGQTAPVQRPNLATLYNQSDDPDDVIVQAPNAPSADSILDKYIQAIGGAQRLNNLTSFAARGTSAGYGPESTPRATEIYAKAPAQRTTIIHT